MTSFCTCYSGTKVKTAVGLVRVSVYENSYQSEVHDGFSHEFSKKAEFHLDLGDVSWLGAAAKRHSKKASRAEHVLGALLAPCRQKVTWSRHEIMFVEQSLRIKL